MTETQLDRIESGIGQLNQRMARMEERQNSQASRLEALDKAVIEHSGRLRAVELSHAVAYATGTQSTQVLSGRWAAVGAVAIVLLATVGSYVARLIAP